MDQKTRSKIESVYQDVAFEKVHLMADVDPACIAGKPATPCTYSRFDVQFCQCLLRYKGRDALSTM